MSTASDKRQIVADYLSANSTGMVTCEEVRAHLSARLGYDVSGPTASRVLGNSGWRRGETALAGAKVVFFTRPI